jgi:hypothetical protein
MAQELTYEQKFLALQSLLGFPGDASLHMRGMGNWYVSLPRVDIKDGGCLSSVGSTGKTPAEAIEKTWLALTENLPKDQYIVLDASDPKKRRAVRWNGFMWESIDEGLHKKVF